MVTAAVIVTYQVHDEALVRQRFSKLEISKDGSDFTLGEMCYYLESVSHEQTVAMGFEVLGCREQRPPSATPADRQPSYDVRRRAAGRGTAWEREK